MPLTKSESVLTLSGRPSASVTFHNADDEWMGTLVNLSQRDWVDFGRPETITVTIEPGDLLNEEA